MTSRAPERTVADLSFLLSHASHVLATQMTAAFSGLGVTPRGFCVLFHALEAERTQIELAGVADLDKTTMVVTVDALERSGLAERRPSVRDRRARVIAVTEAGERMVAEGMKIADRVHGDALGTLAEDQRTVFVDVLKRLVDGHLSTPAAPVRRARQR